ncbi:MAG TPA: hypothetical protein VN698_05885 [Bacteroidia bacterium]|nr:hypothetical protein [Bacteroidia bacterium]
MKKIVLSLTLLFASITTLKAQVKIGDNPNTINSNSMLEIESTNKGFLPPRVTITSLTSASPLSGTVTAGMLVYSSGGSVTDGYYFWNGTKWLSISTSTSRSNYVIVKSASDFPTPVGGVITLAAGTLYEINGTVAVSNKIDLNGCSIQGDDATNDKLVYTGSSELFTGSNVGNLSYLTLVAASGKIFNVSAGGANVNFLVQNCYFIGCNTVGTIQGVGGTVYFANVAYFANTNGITFQNDNNVVLNNTLWDVSNHNTYETFTGTFNIIQILGGDRLVSSANTATAISISGITSLTAGSIKVVMFIGSGTYINGTFSNAWEVEATGLNTEKDDVSSGNIYISSSATTNFPSANTPTKIAGTTTSASLFRVTSPTNNRLTYTGTKTRRFLVICSLCIISGGNGKNYSFYVTKNGVKLSESEMSVKSNSSTDQTALAVSCTVSLAPNDYIEIWGENNIDNTDIVVTNMNLAIK